MGWACLIDYVQLFGQACVAPPPPPPPPPQEGEFPYDLVGHARRKIFIKSLKETNDSVFLNYFFDTLTAENSAVLFLTPYVRPKYVN